jgi:hypothetical protein
MNKIWQLINDVNTEAAFLPVLYKKELSHLRVLLKRKRKYGVIE